MTALDYTLIALACYRLATDVAWEDGPGELYATLRSAAAARFGRGHWVAEGVACPICVSFWVAPVMIVLWQYVPLLVIWFAVAGAAALLARATK